MGLATEYTDLGGNRFPTFAPGGIYLGTLDRGRVCYDHNGQRLKVEHQNVGSATVSKAGDLRSIKGGRPFRPPVLITLARSTVVYLSPQGPAPLPAPPTPEDS